MDTNVSQPRPTHTITIEPVTRYPGGTDTTAVVERYNGSLIKVCAYAEELSNGCTLAAAARAYAHTYGATFDEPAAVVEAVLSS